MVGAHDEGCLHLISAATEHRGEEEESLAPPAPPPPSFTFTHIDLALHLWGSRSEVDTSIDVLGEDLDLDDGADIHRDRDTCTHEAKKFNERGLLNFLPFPLWFIRTSCLDFSPLFHIDRAIDAPFNPTCVCLFISSRKPCQCHTYPQVMSLTCDWVIPNLKKKSQITRMASSHTYMKHVPVPSLPTRIMSYAS